MPNDTEDLTPATRYPWKKWADGKRRNLRHGRDFYVPLTSFAAACYAYAERKGLRCVTAKDRSSGTLSVQFMEDNR